MKRTHELIIIDEQSESNLWTTKDVYCPRCNLMLTPKVYCAMKNRYCPECGAPLDGFYTVGSEIHRQILNGMLSQPHARRLPPPPAPQETNESEENKNG
jgi:rubredoxin